MELALGLRNSPEYGGFCSFMDLCVVKDPKLCTPTRFLWAGYTRHVQEFGFPVCDPKHFKHFLNAEPKVSIKSVDNDPERIIRSVVQGVCVLPSSWKIRRLARSDDKNT